MQFSLVHPHVGLTFCTLCAAPCCALQPCGGAIPLCMVEEFDLPMEIIDRKVTKMKMISPSNRCANTRNTTTQE